MSDSLSSKKEIAEEFDVDVRTVTEWGKQGCPVEKYDGRSPLYDKEKVRRWHESRTARREGQPSPGAPGSGAVPLSRESLAKAELVRRVTIAKKNELELAAQRALKDLGLDVTILAAKSYEDYVAIDLEIGALLARGALSPARARAIQSVIADARQNTKAHREAEGDEEPERLILFTMEGGELVRAFEGIISDERRQAILDYVHAEAELDLEENPNVDLTRAAQEETSPKQESGPPPAEGEPSL